MIFLRTISLTKEINALELLEDKVPSDIMES